MKKTIYYMHKPGEARDYAMTVPPSIEWAQAQEREGFKLYAVEVDVPTLLPTHGTLQGHAQEVPLTPAAALGVMCVLWNCKACGACLGGRHKIGCVEV